MVASLVGELGVELLAVLEGEHGGLANHDGGPPLADLAAGQQVVGVWHLADEHPGHAQVAGAAVGAGASSQGDLCGEALAPLR